jgi:hypothetical protein
MSIKETQKIMFEKCKCITKCSVCKCDELLKKKENHSCLISPNNIKIKAHK